MLLRDCLDFHRIVDNIVIYDKDETSHTKHVKQIFLQREIPYSLKFLRTKIIHGFWNTHKFLSMKISNLAVVEQSEATHENFVMKITFLGLIQQTTKIFSPQKF